MGVVAPGEKKMPLNINFPENKLIINHFIIQLMHTT